MFAEATVLLSIWYLPNKKLVHNFTCHAYFESAINSCTHNLLVVKRTSKTHPPGLPFVHIPRLCCSFPKMGAPVPKYWVQINCSDCKYSAHIFRQTTTVLCPSLASRDCCLGILCSASIRKDFFMSIFRSPY